MGLFLFFMAPFIHMRDLPLWTPLAMLALSLSWLLPNAYPPWLAFHKDAWLATVLCLVVCVRQFRERSESAPFQLDPLTGLLLAMLLMTLWQWQVGIVHFSGHAAMAIAYLGGAALAILHGRDWARKNSHELGDFLFLALVVAAISSSFAMLVQWLQLWEWMGNWVQEVGQAGQPYANLNQPNNAATLMVLGIVGMGWLAYRGKVSLTVWLLVCAYLAFFVAISGSRIGYLSFTTLAIFAIVVGWRTGELSLPWRQRVALLWLVFVAWAALVNSDLGWGSELHTVRGPNAFERDLTSIRLYLWNAYAHAALSQPWTGFGFEQGFTTQLAASRLGYRMDGLYTWSHNVLLDVATWFGLPMAVTAFALVLWLLFRVVRASVPDPSRWLYLAGIYAVVLHGMVELPMAFAYFLFPVCLMTGAILSSLNFPTVAISRRIVAACTVGMGALLTVIVYDYMRIETAFYTWRFALANIGKNHPQDIPKTLVLNQFEALLTGLRGSADTLTPQQVDAFEKAIVHDPSGAAMHHLAVIRMQGGDRVGAQRAADMVAVTVQPRTRAALAARWEFLSLRNADYRSIHWEK